jgi:glutamate/tyrosine decarboxylase-like PLP-dependent enzyme
MNKSNQSKLQLTQEEMRQLGYRVVDQIVEHFESLGGKPVMRVSPRIELEAKLREPLPEDPTDKARGALPFCVIANAGTTNTGAIDPLEQLADLCAEENLWLHVDGAYGAAAALSERGKTLLAGIERADSLSLDPHKWLFQPFEIGCVLVRDPQLLKKTFQTMGEYLEDTRRAENEEINYYDYGVQLTRGFRALKLWLSLKTFGAAAFRQAINHGFELAEFAEGVLRQSECWQVVTPATMGIVTFRYTAEGCSENEIDEIHRRLVERMAEDGFSFANSTALRGRTVMRLCTINPRTTEEDVRATIQQLEQFGRALQTKVKII